MTTVRWTYERRPDTRTTSVRMGIWLFLASEAMFFGSLFSAVVLLRAGAASWATAEVLDLNHALVNTVLLIAATVVLATARAAGARSTAALMVSSLLAVAFLIWKLFEYSDTLANGLHPASSIVLACWFALTGVHAAHVIGGVIANIWVAAGAADSTALAWSERLHALRLYWYFVDLVWVAILFSFYLV